MHDNSMPSSVLTITFLTYLKKNIFYTPTLLFIYFIKAKKSKPSCGFFPSLNLN